MIAGINFGQCNSFPFSFPTDQIKVATNVSARGLSGKAVMNMSLGGSKSTALNSAIAALTRSRVTAIVAAGNENVSEGDVSSAQKLT